MDEEENTDKNINQIDILTAKLLIVAVSNDIGVILDFLRPKLKKNQCLTEQCFIELILHLFRCIELEGLNKTNIGRQITEALKTSTDEKINELQFKNNGLEKKLGRLKRKILKDKK